MCIITITNTSEVTRTLLTVLSLWHSICAVRPIQQEPQCTSESVCPDWELWSWSRWRITKHTFMCNVVSAHHANTLANASAPALAMKGFDGWNATSWIDSSNFLRWDVISWTHVLLSRFHRRMEQSWPATMHTLATQHLLNTMQTLHLPPA